MKRLEKKEKELKKRKNNWEEQVKYLQKKLVEYNKKKSNEQIV